jgi:Icc-related predicted phosphoesterase
MDYQNIPPQHLIGNRPSTVAALKEGGLPFSFLVIGDTHGSETSEALMEKALKNGNASFMVILGDFVKKPDIWKHRFFLTEMTTEMKLPFPVFLVPGNHDIDYTSFKKTDEDRKVTPEVYESLYGAKNFDFTFNGCLFIVCGIDPRNRIGYLNYLRDTLSRKRKDKRHVFVFVHHPPKGFADYIEGFLPNEEEFFSIVKNYKVTLCFFGDYHGYWRGERQGVSFIVSGGGGGRLKESQPEWGKFHHMLRVSVNEIKVIEEMLTVQRSIGIEDKFEEWIFTTIFPVLGTSVRVYYLILIGFIIVAGCCLFKLTRALRYSS